MLNRIGILLTPILALSVILSACGAVKPAPAETATATGGELIRLADDPTTLDPHLATDVSAGTIVVEIFGGLVTLDRDLKVVPDLAESWTVSPDGKTYTFSLNPNAKFHNGKPVTANDFKWSIERAADPRLLSTTVDTYLGDIVGIREKLRGQSQEVTGVKVIDERTLEITIDAPKAYFLAKLTYPTGFVLDQENVQTGSDWTKRANGTGPFKLKEYVSGDRLVLERNPDYLLGPPHVNTVRFLLAGGTPMVMYENDEIHVTGVGLADLDRVRDPNNPLSKEVHLAPPGFQTSYIGFNLAMPPFDDVKVRQALAMAMDKKTIASQVLSDQLIPAFGILPPGFPAFNPELTGLTYDVEKARQLLSESKYGPDPTKLPRMTFTVSGQLGTAIGPDLEAILAMWRDNLGIEVDVQQVEFATFLNDLNNFRLQMYALGWVADYPDPQNFLDLMFHSQSVNNQTKYSNPEIDSLLEKARTEKDEAVRFDLYRQAEQKIVDDAPWIPLWYPGEGTVLIKPEVKDYPLVPIVIPRFRYVSLEQK